MYKVFDIDTCWDQWSEEHHYVGGDSVQDIIDNLSVIFPPIKYEVNEDSLEEDRLTYGDNIKIGDIVTEDYFDNECIEDFKKSLNENELCPRIKEVPHLFTDVKYEILDSYGYIE